MNRMNRRRKGKLIGDIGSRGKSNIQAYDAPSGQRDQPLRQGHIMKTIAIPEFAHSDVLGLKIANQGDTLQAKDLLLALPTIASTSPAAASSWKPSAKLDADYWYFPDLPTGASIYSPLFEVQRSGEPLVHVIVWNGSFDARNIPTVKIDLVVLDRTDPELELELVKGFNVEVD